MQLLKKALIIAIFSIPINCPARKAFVIVPVADLVGEPIKTFGLATTNKESYEKIALCGGPNASSIGAPRIHQLLFNETVEILHDEPAAEGDEEEVCITFDGAFFITASIHKPQHIFWTRKKNLLSFEKIAQKNIPLDYIPPIPSFKKPKDEITAPVIGLIKPFYDPVTHQTFSVGTRFVYNPTQTTESQYAAYVFDRTISSFKVSMVPKSSVQVIQPKAHKEAIICFLSLLRSWIAGNGIIPYVWGGCSYTTKCPSEDFTLVKKQLKKRKKIYVYNREQCKKSPHTGFDCSGIILRAAQLCGIPYFFKNTYTLAHYLKSLGIDDHLHEGDLIWIPGHVMIISDLKDNKLIEARGYSHDFGHVQEIELEKIFKGIKTYKQLVQAYYLRQPLLRLNKAGNVIETIQNFKILKLESVWNHNSY